MVVYNCVYLFFFILYIHWRLRVCCWFLLLFDPSQSEEVESILLELFVCVLITQFIFSFVFTAHSLYTFLWYPSLDSPYHLNHDDFQCVCVCLRSIRFSVSGVNVFVNEFCLAVNENITMPHLCDVCCIYGKH